MSRMQRPLAAIVLLLLSVSLSGCPKGTVAQQALTAVNKYANSLNAFQQAVAIAHKNGTLSDDEDRLLQTKIAAAAQAGAISDAAIVAVANGGDATSEIAAAQAALEDLINSGVAGIKNATTKQELNLAITASADLLETAIALVGQLKAASVAPVASSQ